MAKNNKGISPNQRKYALEILKYTSFLGSNPSKLPTEQNLRLSKNEGKVLADPNQYRRLIERLLYELYLTLTRLDITYAGVELQPSLGAMAPPKF